jgi:hypothetical protein
MLKWVILDEVEHRRNRPFLNEPSSTKFGPVDLCLKNPPIWQTSEQIHCSLPTITAHRTLHSFFLLVQKHKDYKICSPCCCYTKYAWRNVFFICFLGGETCDQWAAKSHWMLHSPLGRMAKKGIYWPIYTVNFLSLTYCYSPIDRPWCLELS